MTGYKIYFSNDLDILVNSHAHLMQATSLFSTPPMIIVQNKSMEQWLKLRLADQLGICTNNNFVSANEAIRKIIGASPVIKNTLKGKSLLLKGDLNLLIYQIIKEEFLDCEQPSSELDFLINYFAGINDRKLLSAKAYEVSCIIADVFSEYVLSRAPMTAFWGRGESYVTPNPADGVHEVWQKYLWQKIYNNSTNYLSLLDILDMFNDESMNLEGLPPGIVIFGSYFLSPVTYQFFENISKYIPVTFLIMTPFAPASCLSGDNKLLGSWGNYGLSHFNYLSTHFPQKGPSNFQTKQNNDLTDLSQVQQQIMKNSGVVLNTLIYSKSIQVHAVTGKQREVEILKDVLLKLLDEDPQLQLTDIGVLAPDIDQYAAYIEAVFDSGPAKQKLPYNIVDLKFGAESHYCSAFLALLELPGARFTRKEIFTLINNPCFARSAGINEDEQLAWLKLCQELEIKWGINHTHKYELELGDISSNSWDDGLHRALLGLAMNNEQQDLMLQTEKLTTIPYNLIFDVNSESLGKLAGIVDSIYQDLFYLDKLTMPLEEWILLARAIEDTYLAVRPDVSADREDRVLLHKAFSGLLSALRNITGLNEKVFDLATFKAVLQDNFAADGSSVGQYLSGGITFSSIKPMRAIPFKVIVMLGMDEAVFPRRDSIFAFDLTRDLPGRIDDSPRNIDKYAFLETFVSAREKFILFYTGKNNITGDPMQPSIILTELLEYLKSSSNKGHSYVTEHKLQNFDQDYFLGKSTLYTFNLDNYNAALAYSSDKKPTLEALAGHDRIPLIIDRPKIISIRDLQTFLTNPVKSFFNKTLGIYLKEASSPLEDFNEKIELTRLDKVIYYRHIIEQEGLALPSEFLRTLDLKGKHAGGLFSIFDQEELSRVNSALSFGVKTLKNYYDLSGNRTSYILSEAARGAGKRHLPALRVGDYLITGTIAPHFEEGVFLSYLSGTPALRHQLSDFLSALIIHAHPGLAGYNLITTALVTEDGEVLCRSLTRQQTSGILEQLLMAYENNLKAIIPAYPEACEVSYKAKRKSNDPESDVCSWYEGQVSGSNDFSRIRDCLYRQTAFSATPDFSGIHEITDNIYSLLLDNPPVLL